MYTIEDLAKMMKVTKPTVHRWMKDEKIKFHKIDRVVRFSEEQLQEFLKRSENK